MRARALHVATAAAAAAAILAGAWQLVWLARLCAGRAGFPLDLEWMEGGMLLHARRLLDGQGIYVAPNTEFIPYVYPPVYPAVLAVLGAVLPLGYTLGRAVSIAALCAALALLVFAAARQAARVEARPARLAAWALGVAGAGAVAAAYEFTGTFYDLVRNDSLFLALTAGAYAAAYQGRGARSAALAGALIALAFFTKQTAAPLGVALGVGLLVAAPRRGLIYGAAAAVLVGVGLLALSAATEGWFWTYVFKLPRGHVFIPKLAFDEAPRRLARYLWPVLIAATAAATCLAASRCLQRRDAIPVVGALAGLATGCIGFGKQWAFDNHFIPAVYFPIFAAAIFAARLFAGSGSAPSAAPGSATASPGPRVALAGVVVAALLVFHDLRAPRAAAAQFVPSAADRAAAARFLDILRAQPGDGFIPFHPYYANLVGKRPFVHRMGVMDVGAALGRPPGLDQALAEARFGFVVLDNKAGPWEFPAVNTAYRLAHTFREGHDAVRSFSGAYTTPLWLHVPLRHAPPPPSGGRLIVDFESGAWDGAVASGDAFGPAPAPAPPEAHGRFAARSGQAGAAATGTLRLAPFVVDRDRLSFLLIGPADDRLRVSLSDGHETLRSATPTGRGETVTWDVRELRGRTLSLVVEDASPAAAVAIDDVILY